MENVMNQQDWTQVCEIELVYKTKIKASNRPTVQSSPDIYQLLLTVWDTNLIELQEQFKVLLLNRANRVLGIYQVSSGGITGTVADTRLILAAALKAGACSIILSHYAK
ncbi:MAG TPA: JAB domain-containing protein [Chitinophagaceae bacterium]|nr:JAB domain-containing protein [Chitinophagaceae bacterium]